MDPIQFAIRNPVKVAVGVLLVVLFGLLSLRVIPVQLVPNVDQPIITVNTSWIGRSPEEMERDVIEKQEDKLKNVSNLRKMTSSASVGSAQIELEFLVGTDIKVARQEVSDSLREVPDYPDDVDEPVISDGTGGEGDPIAWLILTSASPDFDVQTIGDLVEDRVKPFLERIPGVSEVRVYGGRPREVQLEFDPRRIAQRGITFNQLVSALRLENVNVSAGDLEDGKYDVRVRTVGQYDELEQIRNTIVAYGEGGPVRRWESAGSEVCYWYK
jgi:HAE1 family hydrophobic/amphiphilic exporter-1